MVRSRRKDRRTRRGRARFEYPFDLLWSLNGLAVNDGNRAIRALPHTIEGKTGKDGRGMYAILSGREMVTSRLLRPGHDGKFLLVLEYFLGG